MDDFVPLSVREGNWRKKLNWRFKGGCERVAFWLAPWLKSAKEAAMRQPMIQPVSVDSDPDALTEALERAERLAYTSDGRSFRPAGKPVPETRADRECAPIRHEHAFTIVTGNGKRQICSCGAWRRVLPPEERR